MTYVPRAIAAVVLVFALVGCATPSPQPRPAAGVTETPTTTPTAEPAALIVERPASLVNFDCNRMLAAFGAELRGVALEDAQLAATRYYESVTDVDVVLNAGGQVCQATNGQPKSLVDASGMNSSPNNAYEGIELWILPNAAEERALITADHASKGGCTNLPNGRYYCQWNQLVGSTWVYVDYYSNSGTKVNDRMNSFMQEVGATPVSSAEVSRPKGLAPVPATCEALLGAAAAAELAGRELTADEWTIFANTLDIADAAQWNTLPYCDWYDDTYGVGVRTVEGGAWLLPHIEKTVTVEPVTLDAPPDGDRAVIQFNPLYADSVFVFVTNGGNLYELGIYGLGADYAAGSKRAADALLKQLNG